MAAASSTQPTNGSLPIGRRIQVRRLAAGMTRQQLAAIIGGSAYRLANIEIGRTPLHVDELSGIAAALDIPPLTLLDPPMT